jgi:hypothetical protein
MHSDANAIADVWAVMLCGSAEAIPAAEVSAKSLAAIERWNTPCQ